MAGVLTADGKHLIAEVISQRTHVDRDATLKVGLFTNSSGLSAASVLADITVPTGTGYASATLTDASWVVTLGVAAYPQITFTGGAGGWTGSVYGYYIYTVAAGGTARLIAYEIDTAGPHTINQADTYKITPQLTITQG
jgi:hypothetical protein